MFKGHITYLLSFEMFPSQRFEVSEYLRSVSATEARRGQSGTPECCHLSDLSAEYVFYRWRKSFSWLVSGGFRTPLNLITHQFSLWDGTDPGPVRPTGLSVLALLALVLCQRNIVFSCVTKLEAATL